MNPLLARLPAPEQLLRYWDQARLAFERETRKNPRIHLGILAIIVILLLGLWFRIGDSHRDAQKQVADHAQQIAILRRLAGQNEWKVRLENVQHLRVQLESRLWEAESDGLAQANYQDLITRLGQFANLPRVDVRVEIIGTTAANHTYRQMAATVSGPFTPQGLEKFLASLESDGHMLVVDRLRIETAPVPRFEMQLSTYLRPMPPATPANTGRS